MKKKRVNRFMGHDKDGLAVYLETEEVRAKYLDLAEAYAGLEEFEKRRIKEGVNYDRCYYNFLYEDRRKFQLFGYMIFDGRLNGRSMTQRVEQRRKRHGWWFTEIQKQHIKTY